MEYTEKTVTLKSGRTCLIRRGEEADAAEAYVHTVLERGFRTLDFYKSLS